MQMYRTAILASAVALAIAGLAGTAAAHSINSHVLDVRLPDGSVEHIRYVGDQPSGVNKLLITPAPVGAKLAGPPVLPAAVAFGVPQKPAPTPTPVVSPTPVPTPPRVATPALLVEPARPAPLPSKGRQRLSIALGFALVVAVAGWSVSRLNGATRPLVAAEQVQR